MYRKPICKNLNLEAINNELYEIQEACDDVRWFEDDEETLLNALDGNEDEAYEFKMMFADLCVESERMREDMESEFVPECFDLFFVSISSGQDSLLGFDTYEQDYFPLDSIDVSLAIEEASKKLKRLTKDQIIEASTQCFRIYHAYMGIRHRYDCLKAAIDILRDQNTGYLQMVTEINKTYDEAEKVDFDERKEATKKLYRLVETLPSDAWIQ